MLNNRYSSAISYAYVRGVFKKYRTLIFPAQTNKTRELSFGGDV